MMAQIELTPPGQHRRSTPEGPAHSLSLVAVASEPRRREGEAGKPRPAAAVSFRLGAFGADPLRVRYTRVAAHAVGGSAAWCRRRCGQAGVSPRFAEPIGPAQGHASDLPPDLPSILSLLGQRGSEGLDHEAIAGAIVALKAADAVIVGPLSPDDANSPGLVPHLADLAGRAYLALRPPRELIVHPGFAQVARRFQFIQMSHQDACALARGATDIGILAQCLRRLQGERGEFAITDFGGHGLLWADDRWWEIEPLDHEGVDEERARAAFCTAWVVARRFLGVTAARAFAYACSAAGNCGRDRARITRRS
jgi:hypothetical protein